MNNYDTVQAMPVGTVFQFEGGAPWLRGDEGVFDLIPFLTKRGEDAIPQSWKLNDLKITILYQEKEELS